MSVKKYNLEEIERKAEQLRRKWEPIYKKFQWRPPHEDFLAGHEFAPLIATICDETIDADVAWSFPWWLYNKVRSFELPKLLSIDYKEELKEYLREKWSGGREELDKYLEKIPKKIVDALKFFEEEGKTPVTIFEDRPYMAVEVYFILRRIPGIGPKKANMITRDFAYSPLGITKSHPWFYQVKKRFPRFEVINANYLEIPIDVHVVKVFKRIFGYTYPMKGDWRKEITPEEVQDIIAFSKLVFPDLPAKLDDIFWNVGRRYCHSKPKCLDCPIEEICDAKLRLRSS
jgi:endonuclease III